MCLLECAGSSQGLGSSEPAPFKGKEVVTPRRARSGGLDESFLGIGCSTCSSPARYNANLGSCPKSMGLKMFLRCQGDWIEMLLRIHGGATVMWCSHLINGYGGLLPHNFQLDFQTVWVLCLISSYLGFFMGFLKCLLENTSFKAAFI